MITNRSLKCSLLPHLNHHKGPGFALGSKKPDPEGITRRILSDEERVEIREKYSNGKIQKVLAKEYGVCEMTISNICKGVIRKKGLKRLGEEQKAIIRKSFAEGMALKILAALHNITMSGVSYICKGVKRENGWVMKPRHSLSKEERSMLREEFADGKTQAELHLKYNIGDGTVKRICKGVVRRKLPKQRRGTSDEDKLQIRKDYSEGVMVKVLAKRYGLCNATISKICKGVERLKGRKPNRPIDEEQKPRIRLEYSEGASHHELAKKYNISPAEIGRICKGAPRKEFPKECRRMIEGPKEIINGADSKKEQTE